MAKKNKYFVHRMFQSSGFDFIRYSPENFVSLRRQIILSNKNIDLVLDIGANEGTFGQELREHAYQGRIISFEPLLRPYLALQQRIKNDPQWQCKNMAIGNRDGEVEMHISSRETSSSILSIAKAHIQADPSTITISKEKVKILRLDSLLHNLIIPRQRIYLKADVQGYELEVMKGASELLELVLAIELELSLTSMYEGSPEILEMLEYMKELGFELVSLSPVFYDPKTWYMLQVDGIFVRK